MSHRRAFFYMHRKHELDWHCRTLDFGCRVIGALILAGVIGLILFLLCLL
jgi:hypothetical protein